MKIIELPCMTGDNIYIPWIYDNNYGISFHEIEKIEIYRKNIDLIFKVDTDIKYLWIYIYGQGKLSISECGKRFFLTREEAEKKLKKLKDEENTNNETP